MAGPVNGRDHGIAGPFFADPELIETPGTACRKQLIMMLTTGFSAAYAAKSLREPRVGDVQVRVGRPICKSTLFRREIFA